MNPECNGTDYVYLIVRRDLTPVQQLVQVAHAAYQSACQFPQPEEHPHFAVLAVRDETALIKAQRRLDAVGIHAASFYEEDLGGSLTAIATCPVNGMARKYLNRYQLLKETDMQTSIVNAQPAEQITLGEIAPGVFRSRHGFHSYSYETFLKLKTIARCYWRALHAYHDWLRWNRKEPQNRVIRKILRNAAGQKTGSKILGPRDEPRTCNVFVRTRPFYIPDPASVINGGTGMMKNPLPILDDEGILQALREARTPVTRPEDIPARSMPESVIDGMLKRLTVPETCLTMCAPCSPVN